MNNYWKKKELKVKKKENKKTIFEEKESSKTKQNKITKNNKNNKEAQPARERVKKSSMSFTGFSFV